MIIFYDFECTRLHKNTTPMSLGMVSYDGNHEFYAEFTDYDQNQIDEWLQKNVLDKFILNSMSNRNYKISGNSYFFKGEQDWIVNHQYGLINWLKSFNTKITPASIGCGFDFVLLWSVLNFKIIEDIPDYFDIFGIDILSIFRWEGNIPQGLNFKEEFLNIDTIRKHNALHDSRIARDIYLELEKRILKN